jgi:hypothetical protein
MNQYLKATLMTREEWKEVERVLRDDKVQIAMRGRCEEQGHQMENCASVTFRIYQQCKWCGEQR